MSRPAAVSRRDFVRHLACGTSALLAAAPGLFAANAPAELTIPSGVASGDVTSDGAVVWSRSDRPARMFVEVAMNDQFRDAQRIRGPAALDETDFTARLRLPGLPAESPIYYRVQFEDLTRPRVLSTPATGSFRPARPAERHVRLVRGHGRTGLRH